MPISPPRGGQGRLSVARRLPSSSSSHARAISPSFASRASTNALTDALKAEPANHAPHRGQGAQVRRRERGLQGGEYILVLPDAGWAERAGKAPCRAASASSRMRTARSPAARRRCSGFARPARARRPREAARRAWRPWAGVRGQAVRPQSSHASSAGRLRMRGAARRRRRRRRSAPAAPAGPASQRDAGQIRRKASSRGKTHPVRARPAERRADAAARCAPAARRDRDIRRGAAEYRISRARRKAHSSVSSSQSAPCRPGVRS